MRSSGATQSTTWFQNISGIPDGQGRVGNYPDRIEAEI